MLDSRIFKICYVSSEVEPFAKTGGLADVAGALPVALKELGQDIRLMMPKFKIINERKFVLREVIRLREVKIELGGQEYVANGKTAFLPNSKVHVYFLSIPEFFDRKGMYLDPETNKDYPDNAERFAAFSKAVLETLKLLYWQPDIIHCNDWQTALIPFYLKYHYKDDEFFQKTRTLLTIHNMSFQGVFPKEKAPILGIPEEMVAEGGEFELFGNLNLLKGGILFADKLSTVSKTYAKEITTDPDYGFGLEKILASRKKDLFGILNGVDYSVWDPRVDKYIPTHYDLESLEKKIENKKALCEQNDLPFNPEVPVIGIISRMTTQKGFDLLAEAMDELMKLEVQMVILASGDPLLEKQFEKLSKKFPKKLALNLRFDNRMAHLIEAGSDMFLMPSRFEPCGLNQLYSLRYGTVPIVRETGGLADTVVDPQKSKTRANGFTFKEYTPQALLEAVERAVEAFHDKNTWVKLQKNGMKLDFSWKSSAEKYLEVYEKAMD